MPRLYADLAKAVAAHGFVLRGGFAPGPEDGVPAAGEGRVTAALVLVGNVGPSLWPHFAPHAARGANPLDRWTKAVVGPIAEAFGARVVYPFEKPPLPFQRWAMRAEPVQPSPLGILIHPDHGLWHAYRAALLFPDPTDLPERVERPCPCDSCADRPCLTACPVGAFTGTGYDVPVCAAFLDSDAGHTCLDGGCRARGACPVGMLYIDEQIRFHMRAFHAAVAD